MLDSHAVSHRHANRPSERDTDAIHHPDRSADAKFFGDRCADGNTNTESNSSASTSAAVEYLDAAPG